MTINVRRKGSQWERDAAEILSNLLDGTFKRIPGSGALGTQLDEPGLTADIVGSVRSIQEQFRIEAKVGYGGEKQFALKKEWLDKIKKEADAVYGIPLIIGKFSGSREGIKHFIVMDTETFGTLIRGFNDMYDELCELYKKVNEDVKNIESVA